MDKLSLFGILVAVIGILGGQMLEGGSAVTLLQLAAFLIVFGGTVGAVMLQSPLKVFLHGVRLGKWAFVTPQFDAQKQIGQLCAWSNIARKDGMLKLEEQLGMAKDPFMRKGLQMLVDGNTGEKIREVMDVEVQAYEQLNFQSARVWESAAGYAPTLGIMGAVLGLVHVMQSLGDPSRLGGGIAVAFVSTIYGLALANLVFLPVAGKLKMLILRQVALREMVIDGLVMIAHGENTRFIEMKLQGYVS
ncbi:MAG TPA: flagellar motor protein [Gallionellaceae bacterium]|nr:flagellar motor protein [Gallionellaceae bacterium]